MIRSAVVRRVAASSAPTSPSTRACSRSHGSLASASLATPAWVARIRRLRRSRGSTRYSMRPARSSGGELVAQRRAVEEKPVGQFDDPDRAHHLDDRQEPELVRAQAAGREFRIVKAPELVGGTAQRTMEAKPHVGHFGSLRRNGNVQEGLPSRNWRPRPESNRGARICSPLRNHSATRPHVPVAPGSL